MTKDFVTMLVPLRPLASEARIGSRGSCVVVGPACASHDDFDEFDMDMVGGGGIGNISEANPRFTLSSL